MTDQANAAARAVAESLVEDYGPGIVLDVEAAIAANSAAELPRQFVDAVSLGSLIVSLASLAWTMYADQREKAPEPQAENLTSAVREELRDLHYVESASIDRLTDAVVSQVIKCAAEAK